MPDEENIILAVYDGGVTLCTRRVFQYASGMVIRFRGFNLPPNFEVDFGNSELGDTITQMGHNDEVAVPDQFFESGRPVYVWVVEAARDYTVTRAPSLVIPVIQRGPRTDQQPAPAPTSIISQAIAALNDAIGKADAAVEHYPKIENGYWYIWEAESGEWANTGEQAEGADGVGISSIAYSGRAGLVDYYTITLTDGRTFSYTVTNGAPGDPGTPGISPTVTVEAITGGHRLTITDAEHPEGQIVDVMDGTPGAAGRGIVSVEKTGTSGLEDTYQITYTTGSPTTFTITNGAPGASAYVWIRYAAREPAQDSDLKTTPDAWMGVYSGSAATAPTAYTAYTWYKIKGETPTVPVTDVQFNGVSILTNGVANVEKATEANIKAGTNQNQPIVPANEDAAAFHGLAFAAGDSSQAASNNPVGTYTEDAISKIYSMLNAPVVISSSTPPTLNAKSGVSYEYGEITALTINPPASGITDITFTSGATPTALTVTGVTWPALFDPTNLRANCLYEINIKNGKAVVGEWPLT